MANYLSTDRQTLIAEFDRVKQEFSAIKDAGLSLDMSRGKPGADQLDLSNSMASLVNNERGFKSESGTDCRNYGGLDGLPEMKRLFAKVLGMDEANVICGNNASLNLMFDIITQGLVTGFGNGSWLKDGKIKFLCPAPGYDRHFGICEYYGIEMITVRYNEDGPDMDFIEEAVKDPQVKGMWCVPKYSNPLGLTYSDAVVKRIASLKPAAKDFRIMWDNAYVIHDLGNQKDALLNIYEECKKNGNEDMVFMFTSTSKVSFPGAGVAAMACSPNNMKLVKSRMTVQTIGPDKINQLSHARMFPTFEALELQMMKHGEILKAKFDACLEIFEENLGSLGIAEWTNPNGGYFISMEVLAGCAKRVGALCKEAGLVITTPGATFPYGKDPIDSNLRIAPSFPDAEELKKAAKVLTVAVKYAALEKLLG